MAVTINGSTGISNVNGTAAAPAESSGAGNTGLYFPTTTSVGISTAGTNALYIDASQNVGIGTTSPVNTLTVGGNGITLYNYYGAYSANSYYNGGWKYVSNGVAWGIGNNFGGITNGVTIAVAAVNAGGSGAALTWNPAFNIDTSGNVGIGTTSPAARVDSVADASSNAYRVRGRSSDSIGSIQFTDNGATTEYAYVRSPAANTLSFGAGGSERMRIDSSGNLLVGYTSSNGSYKLQVNSQIFATSSTIATSDANYKTNITPLTGALNLVQKLNPVSFNWKKHEVHNFDTETPTVGFLAQEVQSALAGQPYVNSIVKQSEVTLPDDTKQSFLGIAEGNMVALLTKALQETVAKIDALETEVTALKAKVGA